MIDMQNELHSVYYIRNVKIIWFRVEISLVCMNYVLNGHYFDRLSIITRLLVVLMRFLQHDHNTARQIQILDFVSL